MTEYLFRVGMKHKKTGEKLSLMVWAKSVDEATHKVVKAIGGCYGEYSWTGSGPEYGDDGNVMKRERKEAS